MNDELDIIIDDVIKENMSIIREEGRHSKGILLGIAMRALRGRASAEEVSLLLDEKIPLVLGK